MVMKPEAVVTLAMEVLLPGMLAERQTLDEIDKWMRWDPEEVQVPKTAKQEKRFLAKLSETPWLMLVVNTLSQQLIAETVRSSEIDKVDPVWGPWLRNRMGSRQRAIHKAAVGYGYAYTTVMPGDTGAVIRGYSPREMFAVYQDAAVDEYPEYSIRRKGDHYYVLDGEALYTLGMERGKLVYITHEEHDVGVAPVVRYSNEIDLEGRTPGEVQPYIRTAQRINQTTNDRLLIQYNNSWKVRTATGLDADVPPEQRAAEKLRLSHEDILTGGEGVSFGTLDETSVEPLTKAAEADVGTLAAVSQTPAHALTGNMINLSADAITEARAMLDTKAGQRKLAFGDSHAQTLRLSAHVEGRHRDAADFTLQIQWADLESRSMAQAADALGKMATMLGIPPEMLWDRIPTVTAQEAGQWRTYKQNNPSPELVLADTLRRQSNGVDG